MPRLHPQVDPIFINFSYFGNSPYFIGWLKCLPTLLLPQAFLEPLPSRGYPTSPCWSSDTYLGRLLES